MANSISNQAHIDPKMLRQHNNKHLLAEGKVPFIDKPLDNNNIIDPVTINQPTETVPTYSSPLILKTGVKADGFDLLRGLVLNILKEQGTDFKIATGQKDGLEIDISQLSQEDAEALIADDGYFGVDQTSQRIVDFAIAMAGGDHSRLATIKEGVTHGFNEALDSFGGWLPEISYNTYDAVIEKLDNWAEQTTPGQ